MVLGTEGIIGGSLVPPGLNLDIFLLKVVPPLHPGYVWEGGVVGVGKLGNSLDLPASIE